MHQLTTVHSYVLIHIFLTALQNTTRVHVHVHTIRETVAYRLIVFGWNLLIVAVM